MESTFGKRLLAIIRYRGYNQSSFSKHIGIPISTLNSYIKDFHTPNTSLLKKMCEELNCSFDYLFDMPTQPRKIYLDNPKKAMINASPIAEHLNIDDVLISAWFKGQIDLLPKDELTIKEFMSWDEDLVSLASTPDDNSVDSIYRNVDLKIIAPKLYQLSHEELEDVEKYIDFIISKRK